MSASSEEGGKRPTRVACKSSYVKRRVKNMHLLKTFSRSKQYETFLNTKGGDSFNEDVYHLNDRLGAKSIAAERFD